MHGFSAKLQIILILILNQDVNQNDFEFFYKKYFTKISVSFWKTLACIHFVKKMYNMAMYVLFLLWRFPFFDSWFITFSLVLRSNMLISTCFWRHSDIKNNLFVLNCLDINMLLFGKIVMNFRFLILYFILLFTSDVTLKGCADVMLRQKFPCTFDW